MNIIVQKPENMFLSSHNKMETASEFRLARDRVLDADSLKEVPNAEIIY